MLSFDESFWVAMAFVVFIGLILKPVGRFIINGLDQRSSRIKDELDEAMRLKEEAQALLALYQRKHKKSVEEAEKIIAHAKSESERIIEHAKERLEQELERKTELSVQKIAQAEASVVKELRDNAVDMTVVAAKDLILESLSDDVVEAITDESVKDIKRKFH